MTPLDLPDNLKLALAIIAGVISGFMIVKTDLCWRKSIIDALKLADRKIINTILFALLFGIIGFFFAREAGLVGVQVNKTEFWPTLIGGLLCGTGLVFASFTPVTALSALGTGRIYAVWAILGMALAFPVAPHLRDWVSRTIGKLGNPLSLSVATPHDFWSASNPALYLVVGIGLLLLWTSFQIQSASND